MDRFITFMSKKFSKPKVTAIDEHIDWEHNRYLWEYPENIIWC